MMFSNRRDAGRQLAEALSGYRDQNAVVLALPRGGVPVADEVATALHAPLDLLLVRKIGVPWQPELAMGAVVDGDAPIIVRNEDVIRAAGVTEGDFDAVSEAELRELERRRQRYIGERARPEIASRVAIIVDDGIATGATVLAAIRGLRRRVPDKIILAVPVAPASTVSRLRLEVDDLVCLYAPEMFHAISLYYRDFGQVSDAEVIDILSLRTAISSD